MLKALAKRAQSSQRQESFDGAPEERQESGESGVCICREDSPGARENPCFWYPKAGKIDSLDLDILQKNIKEHELCGTLLAGWELHPCRECQPVKRLVSFRHPFGFHICERKGQQNLALAHSEEKQCTMSAREKDMERKSKWPLRHAELFGQVLLCKVQGHVFAVRCHHDSPDLHPLAEPKLFLCWGFVE